MTLLNYSILCQLTLINQATLFIRIQGSSNYPYYIHATWHLLLKCHEMLQNKFKLKSDNLQYNMLGCGDKRLINQASMFHILCFFFHTFLQRIKIKSFECPKSIRNYKKNNTWNSRHLVDESFLPLTQGASIHIILKNVGFLNSNRHLNQITKLKIHFEYAFSLRLKREKYPQTVLPSSVPTDLEN